jgi:transcriptional regulator with XRE-family HTH domain
MAKKKTKTLDQTLSETLKQAIVSSELSQYRIAKESGVSAGVLSRFVNGERDLKLETADKLCKILGFTLSKKESEQ